MEILTPAAILCLISICLSSRWVRMISLSGSNLMPLYQSARRYGLRTAQMRLQRAASEVMIEFGPIRTMDPDASLRNDCTHLKLLCAPDANQTYHIVLSLHKRSDASFRT